MRIVLSTFKSSYHWTVYGSILYEAIRILHYSLLFFLLGPQDFGYITVFASFIALLERIADGGCAYTFGLYRNYYTTKQGVKKFFFRDTIWYLGCMFCLAWLLGIFIIYKNYYKLSFSILFCLYTMLILFLHLLTTEMRMFLYQLLQTKETIYYELVSYSSAIIVFWSGVFLSFFFFYINKNFLAWYFFITIIYHTFLVYYFLRLLSSWYSQLPEGEYIPNKERPVFFLKARLSQLILRLSRAWFLAFWLAPFLSFYYGLFYAGVYGLCKKLVSAVMSIIKATIYFNGNPRLSLTRKSSHYIKRIIFYSLVQRTTVLFFTNSLLISLFLFLFFSQEHLFFLPILLVMSLLESYLLLYEQLYVTQEKASAYLVIKLVEMLFSLIFFYRQALLSATSLFGTILFLQLLTLFFIVYDAYRRWAITPFRKFYFYK